MLRAAASLFARRGVDAVSLREVAAAAKQRNHAAAQYHFGSKEALLDAVLARYSLPIQARWMKELEALEATGEVTLRGLVALMVRPLIEALDDEEGGRDYLLLSAHLVSSVSYPLIARPVAATEASQRLIVAMLPFSVVPPELLWLRMQRVVSVLYSALAERAMLQSAGVASHVPLPLFASDLIDTLTALMSAPASPQTRALLVDEPGD